jgi:plastocyanin
MFDPLDSRALRRPDCYAQRFMKAGTYPYNVLPAFGDCIQRDRPFAIKVTETKGKKAMTQHNVTVHFQKGRFTPDRAETTIETGDLVLWNCPDTGATPYCIVGEKEFFASNRMINECGYSHAFGMAGEYQWRDANGSNVHGVVRVSDWKCENHSEFAHWHENTLKKGTLVMIENGKAEPSSVEIVTGQTVFFAIVKAPGISITDERILSKHTTRDKRTEPGRATTSRRTLTHEG